MRTATEVQIPLKTRLRWVPNANEINTNKHEMYMANARNLHLGPNTTYIPLTSVWVWRWGVTQILRLASGGYANFAFLDTNTKFWRWGSRPMQGPNAKNLRRSGIQALDFYVAFTNSERGFWYIYSRFSRTTFVMPHFSGNSPRCLIIFVSFVSAQLASSATKGTILRRGR